MKGIHDSEVLKISNTNFPDDFTKPEDTIKLEAIIAPSNSVDFLPSINPKTTPLNHS